MGEALRWLAVVEGLGVLAFPLAFSLAPGLRDRGWCLAKPLALLTTTLLLWWGASLHILPNTRWGLGVVIAVWGVGALAVGWRRHREIKAWTRAHWSTLLAVEGAFLVPFAMWSLYRAYTPDIVHTEQPMDLMLYTVVGRARWFPPEDSWLAGMPVSYYYGGYLVYALLGKLAGVVNSVGYNLALSTSAGLAGMVAFGVGASLVPGGGAWPLAGAGSTLALLFLPNLEGALELGRVLGLGSPSFWQAVEIKDLSGPNLSGRWYPTEGWWWWRATRVIDTLQDGRSLDYTIHEFPLFSFLLGDLHPHVSALPFLLGAVALSVGLVRAGEPLSWGWLRRNPYTLGVLGVWTGALGFLNAWDLPLGLIIAWGVLLLLGWRGVAGGQVSPKETVLVGVASALALAVLAVVPFLPFYAHLDTRVQGILPVRGPVSQGKHLLIVWGQFGVLLLPGVVGGLIRVVRGGVRLEGALLAVLLVALPLVAWVASAVVLNVPGKGERLVHVLPFLLIGGVALMGALSGVGRETPLALLLALVGLGALLVMGPELFYIVDTFGTRMNTVFKLSYQGWAVLALATGPALYYGKRLAQGRFLHSLWGVWAVLAGVMVALLFYYPLAGAVSRVQESPGPPTLDGLAYLERVGRRGEREVIAWLRSVGRPGDVLVEAVGDDYSDYGFISAATGIPTLLNWPGHQVQWRRTPRVMDGRAEAVQALYTTTSEEELRSLLERYRITYVVVGPRERSKYGRVNEALLGQVLQKALETDGYAVYQRR
ncbi:hypothetical protein HRbin23_00283 [bacterium HR23]|nr:hypothetical protein HRbin23_00283 [bacterium HR23]